MGKTSKVVVCGMKGVGKTAILEQVIYGNITVDSVIKIAQSEIGQTNFLYLFFKGAASYYRRHLRRKYRIRQGSQGKGAILRHRRDREFANVYG